MISDKIIVQGARQHNLKNIDLEIPKNKLVVITGLSGSGKSSLAFDTLYAEGQRRYVESLSTYARQFLGQMEKPDVDLIEGLSPAISIEQKSASHNPRSTVGTITEIYDYLRLLYARVGTQTCYSCGREISSQTIDQITDQIVSMPDGSKIIILAPLIDRAKGSHEKLFLQLKKDGFMRVMIDGEMVDLEEAVIDNKNKKHTVSVVIDRLVVKEKIKQRLTDSLELASSLTEGTVSILEPGKKPVLYSEKSACTKCGISYPELEPASFSFNSPKGACRTCDGIGYTTEFEPELLVPNPMISLREGAVAPWASRSSVQFAEFLDAFTAFYKTDIYTPYHKLPKKIRDVLIDGSGKEEIPFYFERNGRRVVYKKTYEGLIPNLKRRYSETDSSQTRDEIKQYMSYKACTKCGGTRLNRTVRAVKIGGKSIAESTELSIENTLSFFSTLELQGEKKEIAGKILKEISDRLSFLNNVGLSYLSLNRTATTLSGGESQRIRLATQIGSKLSGVLYVLDEPSIGLHQRDNKKLLETLKRMRDAGNTVLVVEHDEETILESDYVIDMGPMAGVLGGEVIFAGTPEELLKDDHSLTGQYFSGKLSIQTPPERRTGNGKNLVIKGAAANNLKEIDVEIPLGCLTCVTGVSGSGKSTLVLGTILPVLRQRLSYAHVTTGKYKGLEGTDYLDKVIHIDQSPIGKTPRSNPGTYTGMFNLIRDLFSKTPDARAKGYKPGRFSFNVKGGRCEACSGDGILKIEMHFLPDVYVSCDICHGKRYNRETLEIKYKGKNIAEVLDMTINQSLPFFDNIPAIKTKLKTLKDVGLGYIKIGQAATTLSGGEAQRIKLSRELSKRSTGRTVYILDEPTTGLHIDDINRLLAVLNKLADAGNTIIIIEHNLDVIKSADYLIDLGPEGGDGGGEVLFSGTPEEIVNCEKSYTGEYLKNIFNRGK